MRNIEEDCQVHDWKLFSWPALPPLLHRFGWYVKNTGVRNTGRKLLSYFGQRLRAGTSVKSHKRDPGPPLHLKPGEWVEVRPAEEIEGTLDDAGRERGMQFMPEMARCCGKRFQVYKRLDWVFFEESKRRRRIRDTVLLEGSICQGAGMGCDRSCYFFWRESWLKRVDGPEQS